MEGNNLHFHQHGASLVAQLVKNLPAIGRPGSIPGLGKSHGEGNGNLLQYSDLENSMDCIVQGVAKSQTRLNYFYFPFPKKTCYEQYLHSFRKMKSRELI